MKKLTYDVPELIKLSDVAFGKKECNPGQYANSGCIDGSQNILTGGCSMGGANRGIGGCTTGSGNSAAGGGCIPGQSNIS